MAAIKVDADALFRAVTATGFKLLAYHLDTDSGEVVSRTLRPDEVPDAPQGPSVKPLPKLGGDLERKKDDALFAPATPAPKPKLFAEDDGPKKPAFDSEFFKRDEKKKGDPFGDGGFRRESGSRKLAEIFGGGPKKDKVDSFGDASAIQNKPAETNPSPPPAAVSGTSDPKRPRIPAITEAQQKEWMEFFAKEFGDPQIRDQMLLALKAAKPLPSFERVLGKHQRTAQQWERYFRRMALHFGGTWLSSIGVQYELLETHAQ